MIYSVQLKLKENPLYLKYIREHGEWYKVLNRHPEKINDMINEMKERYELRFSDKVAKVSSGLTLINALLGD